eukprot:953615-Rhodomonas_salina.1
MEKRMFGECFIQNSEESQPGRASFTLNPFSALPPRGHPLRPSAISSASTESSRRQLLASQRDLRVPRRSDTSCSGGGKKEREGGKGERTEQSHC